MKFISLKLVFLISVTVCTVKSECNTYLECFGSFFNSFFGNYKNITRETQVGNITVPGFDSVNIDSEDLNDLLAGVSDFIQEELDGNVNFGPQLNVFRNVGNSTAIYVKSITINNNFGNYKPENASKSITQRETVGHAPDITNALNVTKSIGNNVNESKEVFIDKLTNNFEENEILGDDDPLDLYYDADEDDNSTDYLKIDYLEMYKDTTNEYTDLKPTEINLNNIKVNEHQKQNKGTRPDVIMYEKIINNNSVSIDGKCNSNTADVEKTIFPWIAAIFIKNDTSDQFEYYCDGVLLPETAVVTAARCMEYYGTKVNAKNLLVLLGKSSLQSMSGTERAVKVKTIIIHENFTTKGTPENDIAILIMEAVTLTEHIQTACLAGENGLEAVTTGWAITGELTVIPFHSETSENCKDSKGSNTFCAAYGVDVTVCPSYGGIYAVKQKNGWYLRGIRNGDPSDRGLCYNRNVYFTDINNYVNWIDDYSE